MRQRVKGAPASEAMQTAVCIGMDAMRIALGGKPRNYSVEDVIRWLRLISSPQTNYLTSKSDSETIAEL